MKKVICLSLLTLTVFVTSGFSINKEVEFDKKAFVEKYKNLQDKSIYENEYIKSVLSGVEKNNPFSNKETGKYDSKNFYNMISKSSTYLDKNNTLQKEIDAQYEVTKNREANLQGFTVFMFISETTPVEQIKSFSYSIEKLKKVHPGINGLVLTRGLVGGGFDTMAEYVRNFQHYGISKLEVAFHPWAFDYFKLDEVPAFALSYCNNEDFRFKQCEHKYLIRGEMSLRAFLEFIMEKDNTYSKYFYELVND